MLAISASCRSVPVVGKYLEPIGALTTVGILGYRYAPEIMSAAVRSRLTRGRAELDRQARGQTNEVAEAALRAIVSPEHPAVVWPVPHRVAPVFSAAQQRGRYLYQPSVRYGTDPEQVLDVWRRKDLPSTPAPVLVFVPGGGWVHGRRMLQGYTLMATLAEQGWVCLSIDYRVAPQHRWPRHIADVKAAVAWARGHVGQFGGDPECVAIAGCSAGGHLAALAGLTAGDAEFQTELPPDANTAVDAVVGMYGRYDWEDRSTPDRERFMSFLERIVVQRTQRRHPEIFRAASPMARIHPDAPPFLVIHGSADTLIPVPQARAFVDKLRATSRSPVGYLELPGAHHGFDITDRSRTGSATTLIGLFLDQIRRNSDLRTPTSARSDLS